MDNRKLDQLIYDLESKLDQMEHIGNILGGGGLMGKALAATALENTKAIIQALRELKELQQTKKLLDG